VWNDAEYGFELVSVINGKIRDALRLSFKNFAVVGDTPSLGSLYIPLEFLVSSEPCTQWYKLEEYLQDR